MINSVFKVHDAPFQRLLEAMVQSYLDIRQGAHAVTREPAYNTLRIAELSNLEQNRLCLQDRIQIV